MQKKTIHIFKKTKVVINNLNTELKHTIDETVFILHFSMKAAKKTNDK